MNTEDAPGLGEENIIYLAAYVEVKISNPELSINIACISHVQKRFKLLWIWWYRKRDVEKQPLSQCSDPNLFLFKHQVQLRTFPQ